MEVMQSLFVKMIGTLAVLIVIGLLLGGSEVITKLEDGKRSIRTTLLVGLLGGILGIYGNLSGMEFNGAVVSIRDVGPMLSGLVGGPLGGLFAGIIAGVHRLTLGGITATACVIATCLIGLICGILSQKFKEQILRPQWSFLVGAAMEFMHLGIVLLMVKPFETALDIVRQIVLPFVMINAIGFMALGFFIASIHKQRKMNDERSRLKAELESAAGIQNSLLPPINDKFPNREEIEMNASVNAAKEVGGDFYDVFFVGKDKLAFVIADVSGKGIPAALFMVRSKLTIQNCVRDFSDLAEAVDMANNSLCESNEEEMFVTALIGILDLKTGEIRYINAGHNFPVWIKENKVEFIKDKGGIVLAAMEGYRYEEHTVQLEPGDAIFLYTDGVTEAENEVHDLFGDDRLLSSLGNARSEDVNEMMKDVGTAIDLHVAGFDQFDDITMMCLKYKGKSAD